MVELVILQQQVPAEPVVVAAEAHTAAEQQPRGVRGTMPARQVRRQ